MEMKKGQVQGLTFGNLPERHGWFLVVHEIIVAIIGRSKAQNKDENRIE